MSNSGDQRLYWNSQRLFESRVEPERGTDRCSEGAVPDFRGPRVILARADLVVADSIEQCLSRGEIYQAMKAGHLKKEDVLELGNVIRDRGLQRSSDEQITVADLTGVADHDIQISGAVYRALTQSKRAGTSG